MKKILKNTGIGIGIFIGLIPIYLLVSYSLPKIIIQKENTTSVEIPIFILTNGVHTDIVVPAKNTQHRLDKRNQIRTYSIKRYQLSLFGIWLGR